MKLQIKFILKEMDVHRAYLDELDNRINILFFVDLLEECRQLGLAKGDLRKLASAMFLSIEGTASEKLFRPCAFHCEAYKNIGEIVNLFDTNFYYDFKVTDLSGKEFDFASLKGKKILIVNTASKCGLTKQYKELEQLYKDYKGSGLEIVGLLKLFDCYHGNNSAFLAPWQ